MPDEPTSNMDPMGLQSVEPQRDYRRWLQRIRSARKLRTDWERKYDVQEIEEFYEGEQVRGVPLGDKAINHFTATIRTTQPGLLFRDPKFLARPKPGKASPVSKEKAKIAEGVLEAIARQDENLENASKLALLQNFFRIGVLKIIYDPKLEPNPRSGEPIFATDANGNYIRGTDGQPQPEADPQTGQPMTEPEFVMADETYRWEWVDAKNMLLPDEGPDASRWTWVGEEIEVSLEDAKADERFPAEMRARMKPSGEKNEDEPEYSTEDKNNENLDPCFRYVECYDLKAKRWYILSENEDFQDYLLDEPLPDGIEDHPYAIILGWKPEMGKKACSWPIPYVKDWVYLQKEYNIRRQQMMEGAKRSARKIGYDATTFDDSDEAVKALVSSKDMEAVLLKDVNRPPIPLGESDLNPSIYNDVPALQMDWRIVTGQTGQKLSGASSSDTATEASFVEQASNMRDAELQRDVVRWLKCAGRKMWQVVQKTLTLRMFVAIKGMDDKAISMYLQSAFGIPPQALAMFPALADSLIQRFGETNLQPVTREQLDFEADIDIVPGSTRPRNLSVERQQWLEFLTLLAQAPQIALARGLLEETAAKFDFIDPGTLDEIHALAIQMMQAKQAQAGHGGASSDQQNSPGNSASANAGEAGAMTQGAELQ